MVYAWMTVNETFNIYAKTECGYILIDHLDTLKQVFAKYNNTELIR